MTLFSGPCAGKTSALTFLVNQLKNHPIYKDYDVYTVCESATLLGNCGPEYPGQSEERREELILFESELLKLQIQLEETIFNIAKFRNKKAIIICDRGALDLIPYIPHKDWLTVLSNTNYTEEVLAQRYDAVIHLVSVAIGAEQFYSSENNAVRIESLEESRELDDLTYHSWMIHPHLFRVDNSSIIFQEKLDKVYHILIELANKHFSLE